MLQLCRSKNTLRRVKRALAPTKHGASHAAPCAISASIPLANVFASGGSYDAAEPLVQLGALAGCSSSSSSSAASTSASAASASASAASTSASAASTSASAASTSASAAYASAAASSAAAASSDLDAAAFDALIAAGPVASADEIAASQWATKVKEAGKLRVGGVQTSALFSLLNATDNQTRGFDAGLYRMLARYILGDDASIDFTLVQSSTRESVLQSDQVDAVFATYSITPKRQEVISFAGPYFVAHQGILVKAGNTDINGVEGLAGKTVGVQQGSTGPAIVEEYAPEATVQELGTDEELRTALEQGRIDAYVVDSSLLMSSIVSNPGKYRLAGEFGPEDPYGIGLPLDSDGVAFVNTYLQKLITDGTWLKLWQITIGDRTGAAAPAAPVIG